MATKKKPATTAKLFVLGRSQAIKLPKDYRFEGKEVRVRRDGDNVILEPMKKTAVDVEALWARLDAMGARNYLTRGVAKARATKRDPRKFFEE